MPSASTRIAVAADRRALDEEAALGADRHDHRVLDHLRLHQAQHLGAEILAAIGPAQAAARHRAEAQVHALDARRVDEDLAIRTRLGQVGHLRRIELEADVVARAAVALALVEVGAQGGVDHADEAAQDAVVVEAGHAIEQDRQRVCAGIDLGVAILRARVDHCLRASCQRGLRSSAGSSQTSASPQRPAAPVSASRALLACADRSAPRTVRPAGARSPDSAPASLPCRPARTARRSAAGTCSSRAASRPARHSRPAAEASAG